MYGGYYTPDVLIQVLLLHKIALIMEVENGYDFL